MLEVITEMFIGGFKDGQRVIASAHNENSSKSMMVRKSMLEEMSRSFRRRITTLNSTYYSLLVQIINFYKGFCEGQPSKDLWPYLS